MFVNVAMNQWVDDRRSLALQETASYLSSSIQQIYLSLNHTSILGCTLKSNLGSQPLIEGYVYVGNATLQTVSGSDSGSSKVLDVTLDLVGTSTSTTTSVTLGQNVEWANSTFTSNSANACIIAEKFANQTIQLSFGT
jgi:hypothetical protein